MLCTNLPSLLTVNMPVYFDDDEDITDTIRDAVFERDGDDCWLCGEVSHIHIAHQIAASAFRHPFPLFKANGTIDIPDLSHPDNLIPLCPTCYVGYDSSFPDWIMVPDADTLRHYINYEKEDYERRQGSQGPGSLQGALQGRTLPSIDRTKVLYYPMILRDDFRLRRIEVDWPKHWQGDPTTVIHRSAWHGILDSNPIRPIGLGFGGRIFNRGIDPLYPGLIRELMRLWSRAPR